MDDRSTTLSIVTIPLRRIVFGQLEAQMLAPLGTSL